MNGKTIKKLRAEYLRQADAIRKLPDYARQTTEFSIEYNIAQELHRARQHAGISQAELAKRLKTTQSVISRLESGRANISVAKLNEYAIACGGHLQVKITA